jgi:hypothetical protein
MACLRMQEYVSFNLPWHNVFCLVTGHDIATDHTKYTQAPGAGMLNYPAHKLNFHSLPATTQPWAE